MRLFWCLLIVELMAAGQVRGQAQGGVLTPPGAQLQPPTPTPPKAGEEPKQQPAPPEKNAGADQRGTDKIPLVIKTAPSRDDQSETDEQRKNRIEKASQDRWTLIFTGATTIFTGLLFTVGACQIGLFWWQLGLIRKGADDAKIAAEAARDAALAATEGNQISRDNLATSHRAWLRPKVEITGPLTYNPFESRVFELQIAIEIENVGVAPAVRASISQKFFIQRLHPDIDDDLIPTQRKLAEEARSRSPKWSMSIVFPGTKTIERWSVPVFRDAFDTLLADHEAARGIDDPDDACVVRLAYIGCVTYQFPSSTKWHQTWFAYEIKQRSNKGDTVIDDLKIGAIPVDELELCEIWLSERYAD